MKEGNPNILEAFELTKSYRGKVVVDRVSMNIHTGKWWGSLVPMGRAKPPSSL